MKKALIIFGVVIVLIIAAIMYLTISTKSHSPLATALYKTDNATIEVVYCRPYKNGREIFGALAPYGKVWRTGANEATTFATTKDLTIQDKVLPAGKYSLWTIPNENSWEIIFNKEYGQWGVDPLAGGANRDAENDQLTVTVPSYTGTKVIEQFTITFDKMDEHIEMILMWDNTTVVVPFFL